MNRRRVLQVVGGIGVAGALGTSSVSAQSSIELEGEVSGWQGVAPDEIAGESNPTLTFEPDEDVTVQWTNADGAGHNFVVVDSDGGELVSTDIMAEEGATQTVEFTASAEMAEYYCQPHPQSMRGSIEIEGDDPRSDEQQEEGDESAGPFTKTHLADVDNGMKLEAAPDGRLFYTTRGSYFEPSNPDAETIEEGGDPRYPDDPSGTGEVGVIDPESGDVTTALELDVYTAQEDGLQGMTFDPNFEENGWVYLFYSPPNEEIADDDEELESLNEYLEDPDEALGDPYNRVSRFTVEGNSIDPESEVELLRIHTQRETCCHVGGDLVFDNDGYLLITTGDDTDPFESDGYTPIDERDGRQTFDAQRTAANTADLRGKILRICPHDDGSYSIPDGNLFPENEYAEEIEEGLVRPEIHAMGLRNPFTIEVDPKTGDIYTADYGPDAEEWDANRGPIGIVEVMRVNEPGFYGWPYFTGPNIPYIDGEFIEAEEEGDSSSDDDESLSFESSGEPFDPENPVNDSPNNDGLEELPPAQPADIWYPASWDAYTQSSYVDDGDLPYGNVEDLPWVPEVEGGAPMTGSVYRPDYIDDPADVALPPEYEGKHFVAEFNIGWIKAFEYDDNGDVAAIEDVMPEGAFSMPQDLEIGPDGVLYVLEYNDWSGRGGSISRLEYTGTDGADEGESDDE